MKKVLVATFLLLCLLPSVWAASLSQGEALQRAQAFLRERGMQQIASQGMRLAVKGKRTQSQRTANDYYVFNVGQNDGFVVVSGDDRTEPVLGYADHGSISDDDMPTALRYMLDGYAEQIAWLDLHPQANSGPRRTSALRTAISPLIQTRWNQGAPYNKYCPVLDDTQTVTGCVATSMAQVMYYHQWPKGETTAFPGYATRNNKFTLDGLDATTFNWSAMKPTYSSDDTGESADAVAVLMQYCGWALQMNYDIAKVGGSSAYNVSICEALKANFDYAGTATYVLRTHYNYQEWVNLIYTELANDRPVVLGGQSAGGGHSFVCDGYDTDDYFHINWGWGGSSDGYFRLSALNPYEQGIGGSSTLDGFSYSQEAVIGIQPNTNGSQDAVVRTLSLEQMQFDKTGTTATQTLTRENASDAFTDINLYFLLCNYTFDIPAFDIAMQFVAANGEVLQTSVLANGKEMTFNKNYIFTSEESTSTNTYTSILANLSTPEALADGSYNIKIVSRPSGQTEWQDCYGGHRLQISAEVSGNTMTLTAPVVCGAGTVPTAVTFTVNGNQTQGYEQEVIASVTGNTVGYNGNLLLRVNNKTVMGKSVEIPAGQTVDVRFSYIPTTAGDNVLRLYTATSVSACIGEETISIGESDATNDLDLTFDVTIDNQTNDGRLYGNALRATVIVGNPSADNSYVGQLNCSARRWTSTDNVDGTTTWAWSGIGVTHYPLTVEKEGSAEVHIAVDDLPSDGIYSFRLTYQRVTAGGTVANAIHLGLSEQNDNGHGTLTVAEGYSLGDATGTRTVHPVSDAINAGNACFVDLRGFSSTDGVSVTPSSNPNCLYLLPDGGQIPSSLDGRNVVCNAVADQITLTDGYDFYTPIDFTATNISYTRTFTIAAAGSSGWNSLMLPFTASRVECEGNAIDWFHSDTDTGKNFWLKTIVSDAEGRVNFAHATELTALTPYIIAVPGNSFGEEWKLTDKPIVFSATNASIAATTQGNANGDYYKFCGTTTAIELSDVYVLNAKGSKFVKKTSTNIEPFRAWISPVSISSLTRPSLTIGSEQTDGIVGVQPDASTAGTAWYSLDGRRLTPSNGLACPNLGKGIYIKNGKKILVP